MVELGVVLIFFLYIFFILQFFYNEHELLLYPEFYLLFLREHVRHDLLTLSGTTQTERASPSQGFRFLGAWAWLVREPWQTTLRLTLSSEERRRWCHRDLLLRAAGRSAVAIVSPVTLGTYCGDLGSSCLPGRVSWGQL